jgi:hypothetical protein
VTAQPSFWDLPPDPATPAPKTSTIERKRKRREIAEDGARRWIDAGKGIAIEVARANGRVWAETFRAEAQKRGKLPPTYGNQRALHWIPRMFWELCQAGHLRKVRHPNGHPLRIYSKEMRNDQVVYELAGVAP